MPRPAAGPWALVAMLCFAPLVGAQDKLCGTCETTGVIDIELDKKVLVEYDHGDAWKVEFCSVAIERPDLALDWAPCPRGKATTLRDEAQARWDAISESKHAWLADRQIMDKLIDKEIVHIESTHFVIAWDISRIVANKKPYRSHDAAHLYIRRMEAFYEHYQSTVGVTDKDNMRNKHHIYIFEKLRDAMAVGPVYANMTSTTTARRAGGVDHESTLIMFRDKNGQPKDEDMHRHWIHSLVHQFSSVHYNPFWFVESGKRGLSPPWLADKYGWLDAGSAHWFEIEFDGKATTYCMQEQDTSSRWKGGDWKKNVFKAVASGRAPSFAEVKEVPTAALSPQQHQFCWAWIDFLMSRDPKGLGEAIKLAKHEVATRDILKQAWGVSMLGFEAAWAEWVLVEYDPNRKTKR